MFRYLCLISLILMILRSDTLYGSNDGYTGRTLKTSTRGCGNCHGSSATSGVQVTLTGPDTVILNQSTTFILTISGGPASGSGCDIATRYGSLAPLSSNLKLASGELTHKTNTNMPGGSVTFEFSYTYSGAQKSDTLFATGNSTNSNGGTSGDAWNWAPNKVITIITPVTQPSAPVLVNPSNQAVDQDISLQFGWHSATNASSYYLQLSADSQFASFVVNDSIIADTVYHVTSLSNSTAYFWRVSAKNEGGTSNWSNIWKFTTITSVPDQIMLNLPENNAQLTTDTAKFIWGRGTPAATEYWFEIAVDSMFTGSQIDSNLTDTVFIVRNLSNGTFWWRVRGYNIAGWGSYSEVRNVTINATGIENEKLLPVGAVLKQNYPNPFNPITTISYTIPKATPVKIKIYSILGCEVGTLVDEKKEQGDYEVTWNSGDMPSGIYLYRIVAGSYIETKKMVLMK